MTKSHKQRDNPFRQSINRRFKLVKWLLFLAFSIIAFRLIQLGITQARFLTQQNQQRTIRTIETPAYRGMIIDRHGQPLAVSTPVISAWANPQLFKANTTQLKKLANILNVSTHYLRSHVQTDDPHRQFVWVKRGLPPQTADQIKQLHISGLFFKREYKRFYPQGPITAQLVGFTNIDQKGQEGLERKYNEWLAGQPGKQRVVKDQLGRVIAPLRTLKKPQSGHELQLSIDYRLQYQAYHRLKQAIKKYRAQSGTVVILRPQTGEVLTMANAPSFNPNNRPKQWTARYRNRAVTDIYEPGSTMKTFSMLAALESSQFTPRTTIDTNPGWIKLNGRKITDEHLNHGKISVAEVLQKSSNVGISKILLHLRPNRVIHLLQRFGFGHRTRSNFPGEASGRIPYKQRWQDFELASLGFGYGIAITPLQLAKAYAIIANDGRKAPITLVKQDTTPNGSRVISHRLAQQTTQMLKKVTHLVGTGHKAQIKGYEVAGKTATSHIAGPNGYYKHRYIASFVGFVPADSPQLVIAVILRQPQSRVYFGGLTAAPLFAKIGRSALQILNIPPATQTGNQTHD